ncbi:MAG: ATP-binding protein [Okeania sp. SIO2C2]|uniref:AAA family ATPase n=1 Tax=Okeania sp. SIO2C2 TaxID=2607787 RepID=UPI0013BA3848|nr:AAA family ATPase [Okeania sp. SIO2C2]NEP87106.1 ATP-binding protein [Okeania sp. SIO2C2]
MYLRECFIENVGPISKLDISLSLDDLGNPKPLILVGKNGTGKTIFLAYILDALAELAKKKFPDIAIGQQLGHSPFLKVTSRGDIRFLSGNSLILLEFSDAENKFCYVEKIGKIDPNKYIKKLKNRFKLANSIPINESFHKGVTGDEKQIETFFQTGAVCFFPSSRHERPHWLNYRAVEDRPLFSNDEKISGELRKPLIVERSAKNNQQWLMDVLVDSLVDIDFNSIYLVDGKYDFNVNSDIQQKMFLNAGRENVEKLLCEVLEDEKARLVLNYRNCSYRIGISLGNEVIIPSLNHLSAGQALLFNLFATIIRYADMADIKKSISLSEIKGIILIDEIDAHLHTDLQYKVLPQLVKLFPKVQFIVTSHSPLFLLGMEREFGVDGIQILEMPTGKQITTERFEEFKKSFEFYTQTKSFEDAVEKKILEDSKPLVLTEGKTDVAYIKTALELLGHQDLLEQLEIDEIGKEGKDGGDTNLNAAKKIMVNNQSHFTRKVLLLYDCDTGKKREDFDSILIRCIPENTENNKAKKGIENLLPVELFEKRFYKARPKTGDYGEESIIQKFDKEEFCEYICQKRREKGDFLKFEELLIPIIEEFLEI